MGRDRSRAARGIGCRRNEDGQIFPGAIPETEIGPSPDLVAVSNGYAESLHRKAALRNRDRKSTRLNSSHTVISYAVFCLKKKKDQPVDGGKERDSPSW